MILDLEMEFVVVSIGSECMFVLYRKEVAALEGLWHLGRLTLMLRSIFLWIQ